MMCLKKTILIILCLCLTGFAQEQEPVAVESYDNPGYFITHTGTDQQAEIIQGGDQSLSGKWLLVPGLADAEGISFRSVDNPDYLLRHANFNVWLNEETDAELFQNDATWFIREGLANPAWVSFESINYPGQYLMHDDTLGLVLATPDNDELGAATFKIIYDLPISRNPDPNNMETDVYRDVVLSWKPGKFAASHNVYLGTNFNDVDSAEAGSPLLVGPAQDANTYDAGRLELGQTYYWRIDDINAAPSTAVWKGSVWSFTVEPFTYDIAAEDIIATASSHTDGQGPENTINRSGLTDNLHSKEVEDMWLSGPEQPGAVWIQYEFDIPYMLHEMLVWNYNAEDILTFYGLSEVKIEYSLDAVTWMQLENVPEFTPATGMAGYESNTTVAFDGAAAKYVRITANSNWSMGIFDQFGLSEVMFMYIPVSARKPAPQSGALNVSIEPTLSFRPGRQADEHRVYISDDIQSVIDKTAPAITVNQASYNPPALDLENDYYWLIEEVNNIEIPSVWQSGIWNFSTQKYLVVDDFELYNDIPEDQEGSNLVYLTWTDGYDNPSVNGSTIGYLTGSSLETDNIQAGLQSVPLFYDNTTASLSEVVASTSDLPIGRDWSKGSPTVLIVWIHGVPINNPATDQLYVKLGSTKFIYEGDISIPQYKPFIVDLSGVNLSNVSTVTIGLERIGGSGSTGKIFIDEIRLYKTAPAEPAEEIWIEAEAPDSIEEPMMIFDDPNASAGQYIMKDPNADESTSSPPDDGLVTYTFTVAGGTYKIAGRVLTDGNSDSFWVRIPDAVMNVEGDPANPGWIEWNGITQEDVWGWEDVFSSNNDDVTVEFTLEAGTYTLEIRYREDESQLDAILITSIDQ